MSPVVQTMFNTISLDDDGGGTSTTPSTPTSPDLKFVLLTGSTSPTLSSCGSDGVGNGRAAGQPSNTNNNSKTATFKFIETCYDRLPSAIRLGGDRKKKMAKMDGKETTANGIRSTPSMTVDDEDGGGDVPIRGGCNGGAPPRQPKLTISIDEEPYSGLAKLHHNTGVRTDGGGDRGSNSYGYRHYNNVGGNRREMIDYDGGGYGALAQQQKRAAGAALNSRHSSTSLQMRQPDAGGKRSEGGGGSEKHRNGEVSKRRNGTTNWKNGNGGAYTTSRGGDTFTSSTSDEEEKDDEYRNGRRPPTAWSTPLPKLPQQQSPPPPPPQYGCRSDPARAAAATDDDSRPTTTTMRLEATVLPFSHPAAVAVKSHSVNDVFTYDATSSAFNHHHQAPSSKPPLESSALLVALDVAALDRTLPTTANGIQLSLSTTAINGGGAANWSSISIPSSPTVSAAAIDFYQQQRPQLQSSVSMALCESTLADEMREAMRKYKGTPNLDLRAPDRVFKVVFVGDSGVGKTCFLHQFCHSRFKPLFNATIGVDFTVKTISVRDRLVAVQLWDTAGQERFRSITKQYFRKADGVVLMYDVTSEQSYLNVRNWIESVRIGVDDECVMCLVGNKVDLYPNEDCRTVTYKHGRQLADEFDMLFFETSAYTGSGIHESMQALAERLQQREEEHLEEAIKLERMGAPDSHSFCFCF